MSEVLRKPLAELPDPLPIHTARPFRATVRPPGSKSLTNRALLLAALARGKSILRNPLLDADDAQRMLAALRTLGAHIDASDPASVAVEGVAGRWRPPEGGAHLDLGNAGTATRFLAAAAILSPEPVTIDGNARMRQRPIGELAASLLALGARVEYLGGRDLPPLRITPPARARGLDHALSVPTTQSSQFISALLLIAPWLELGVTLRMEGEITSPSYIEMTLGLLARLGACEQTSSDLRIIRVGPPRTQNGTPVCLGLKAFEYDVEPDASGATYFWAAAALLPGSSCGVPGLGDESLQGDVRFVELLENMGARIERSSIAGSPMISCRGAEPLAPISADLSRTPDAAMTLASVACFARGTSVLRGLRTLRVKETDRIAAMKTELTRLGVEVKVGLPGDPDALSITPPASGLDCSPGAPRVEFHTYDDHRMAMSLALIGLRRPNVFIKDPACVAKTYPTFWRDFASLLDSPSAPGS